MKYKFLNLFVLAVLILASGSFLNPTPVEGAALCSSLGVPTAGIVVPGYISVENSSANPDVTTSITVPSGTSFSSTFQTFAEPNSPVVEGWPMGRSQTYAGPLSTGRTHQTDAITGTTSFSVSLIQYCQDGVAGPLGPYGPNGSITVNVNVVPVLSCAHDTNQAEPIYPNAGAKFRATGGTGTYSWSYSTTPAAGNLTTGIEVWPAWTDSGTKTATVMSGTQTATCNVYITPVPAVYNVTATKTGTGTLTPTVREGILPGSQAEFTVSDNVNTGFIDGGCPVTGGGFSLGNTLYKTGPINGNCDVKFTFFPLSCAVDTATTPAPHYTGVGVKFLASNGVGTYSWLAPGATPSSGTGNQIWPIYSTVGTKTVSVSTPTQAAVSCTVSITTPPPGPVNGLCSNPDAHYTCSSPAASTNNVDGASSWTWTCPGSNGGTNDSCSEPKLVMSGTLSPSSSTCYIPAGETTCTKLLTWTTSSPVAVSAVTSATGTPSPSSSANNSSQTFTIPYNNGVASRFYLHNNGIELTHADVTPYCVAGTEWSGIECVTVVNPMPDLVASASTPITDTEVNVARTYTSTITNQGTASTGVSFPYFLQLSSPWYNEAGATFYDLPSKTMSALVASGSASATDSYAFNGVGHKSIRFCADKTSNAGGGVITESDETNNCSPWTNITVTAAPVMSGTLTASNCEIASGFGSCNSNLSWTTTNPEATSEVTTPTNISVGTGLNGSATYPVAYGNRTFYLYNNAKSLVPTSPSGSGVVATATCVSGTTWDGSKCAVAAPSCTPTPSFSGSLSPTPVTYGGAYTVSCDYGVISDSILPDVGSGSCSWNGFVGTRANFNCTAGFAPGTFSNNCIINNSAPTYPYCSSVDPIDNLVVTAPPFGSPVAGSCGTPAKHYSCASPTPSINNNNGISSWTWTCPGQDGGASDSCVEAKKKPIIIED